LPLVIEPLWVAGMLAGTVGGSILVSATTLLGIIAQLLLGTTQSETSPRAS